MTHLNDYTESILKIKVDWHDHYKMNFITPEKYAKVQQILSEARKNTNVDIHDWTIISSIYKTYAKKYYTIKELIAQEPRTHAQRFIGKKKIREFIFNRDGKKCLRCGNESNLTIDHIVSVYHGGENKLSNLQTLCSSCNSWKNTNYIDFR